MEFKENTLSVDFHSHRATLGYLAETSGVNIYISSLPIKTAASEMEATVQTRVRSEVKAILARLVAELENPGG